MPYQKPDLSPLALERITEALCAAAVRVVENGNAPTQLKALREALVTEVSAVYGFTPAASPGKRRSRR